MTRLRIYIDLTIVFIFLIIICNQIVIQDTSTQIFSEMNEVPIMEDLLILGTSKDGKNGMNPYFKYRMDAAIELFNAGKAKRIIVSGDNSAKNYNETKDMANYLIANGIPSNAIIEDYAGFRTLDSVVRAKKVFKSTSLIIVSQKFHNQRALYIANYYNMDAIAYNAEDVSKGNYTHIREYFAKCLVIFDLHIFGRNPKFL